MTTPTEASSDQVSINEIGWLFVKNYYHTYTSGIDKLFAYYDKNASLLHDEFPAEPVDDKAETTKKVHLADGTDAIKKHFAQQSVSADEKNKIVIERADFQHSVGKSILIVVCGSWKRGSSSLWQFVQTFVLKPVDTKLYDVSNDVLRFIDFAEEYREPEVLVQSQEPEETPVASPAPAASTMEPSADAVKAAATAVANGSAESTATPAASDGDHGQKEQEKQELTPVKQEKSAPEPQPAATPSPATEPAQVQEKAELKETKEPAPSAPASASSSASTTASAAASSAASSAASTAASAAPSAKPTWANLAAIEPKVPSSKTATVASPVAAKNARAPSPIVRKPSQSSQGTTPVPQPQPTQKYRKEEWYPIYIRNVDVEEDELKSALIETFGDIKFFKKTLRAALCDFRHKEDQQKALEAKEITIRDNVISLEPRLHKVFNGKPDAKFKDKKIPNKKAMNGKKY